LFGWDMQVSDDPQYGGYQVAQLQDRPVAGIGGKQDPNMPSVWSTMIAVDSADEHVAKAAAAGGQVLAPVMEIGSMGRLAVLTSPDGAAYGVWQAGEHAGAGVVNEPGALSWNELHTKQFETAQAYYGEVFGGTYTEIGDENFAYSTIQLDGKTVGGMMPDTQLPDGMPNYWLVWFAVSDCDGAVATAAELGSTVLMPPMDSPFGRSAVVSGPQGETFAVIDLSTASGGGDATTG
jgi:predicted enzyme related to lactoylglutathione lyase